MRNNETGKGNAEEKINRKEEETNNIRYMCDKREYLTNREDK